MPFTSEIQGSFPCSPCRVYRQRRIHNRGRRLGEPDGWATMNVDRQDVPGTEGGPMPIHDWSRVGAGIFHDFHHAWIEEIKRALNGGLLPDTYYALAEQHAAGFGPDVLTLQGRGEEDSAPVTPAAGGGSGLLLAPPKVPLA